MVMAGGRWEGISFVSHAHSMARFRSGGNGYKYSYPFLAVFGFSDVKPKQPSYPSLPPGHGLAPSLSSAQLANATDHPDPMAQLSRQIRPPPPTPIPWG